MGVNRCICRNVHFTRIADAARVAGPDLARLGEITGCGTGCGMCLPYIKRMLITGCTNVPVMTQQEIAALMKDERVPTR